jgi:hypothetical protein
MSAAMSCLLCRRAAESRTSDGRYAFCRECCRTKLLPLVASALGKQELLAAANEIASEPSEADKKIAKLIAARPVQAATVQAVRRPLEFSRGTGTPAAPGRRMTQRQQLLALARAQAKDAGQVFEGDVPAMVRRAGLKTNSPTELSTATAGTGTAATTRATARPAAKGKSKVPSKADIRAMCEKAGLGVA